MCGTKHWAMDDGSTVVVRVRVRVRLVGGSVLIYDTRQHRNDLGRAVPQVGRQGIRDRELSEPGRVVGARDVADSIVFGLTHVDENVENTCGR